MSGWELPRELTVCGKGRAIRSDYRAALDVLTAFSDPELDGRGRAAVLMSVIFVSPEAIPSGEYPEAVRAACSFLNGPRGFAGQRGAARAGAPRLYDWEADADLIAAAVCGVAGRDVRAEPYLHWWTFLSYFYEIGDCLFSTVVAIRKKKASRQRLTREEERFFRENPELFAARENEDEARLLSWLSKGESGKEETEK